METQTPRHHPHLLVPHNLLEPLHRVLAAGHILVVGRIVRRRGGLCAPPPSGWEWRPPAALRLERGNVRDELLPCRSRFPLTHCGLYTAVRGRSPPAGMAGDAQSQAGRPKAQSSIERGKGVRTHGAIFVREQVVSRGGKNHFSHTIMGGPRQEQGAK